MPVNYLTIQKDIREKSDKVLARRQQLADSKAQALQVLVDNAASLLELQKLVDDTLSINRNLRCAVPMNEPLDTHIDVSINPPSCVLIAADGSQINPSRHDRIEFGVINLGAIRVYPGQPEPHKELVKTELLLGDDLNTPSGKVNEEIIALRRDIRERNWLKELSEHESQPVITLTDGPLELFGKPKENGDDEFSRGLDEYIVILRELAAAGVTVAGYVDRPRSDLIIRLLGLAKSSEDDLSDKNHGERTFSGITDASLMERFLQPGQRSAIFRILSPNTKPFTGETELHFFYLNVSQNVDHDYIARVEIPAWVAHDSLLIERLHTVLIIQSRQMGPLPYPYILHRAHEIAVVPFSDKGQIEDMIAAEFARRGIILDRRSNKQNTKGLPKRTKYK